VKEPRPTAGAPPRLGPLGMVRRSLSGMGRQVGTPGEDDRSAAGTPSTSVPAAVRPHFGPVLRRAHLWAGACAEAAFPSDFHVSGLPVLLAVADAPASQRELADRLGLNRTLMVQIVDRLEGGGLVAGGGTP
jgi:MarR family